MAGSAFWTHKNNRHFKKDEGTDVEGVKQTMKKLCVILSIVMVAALALSGVLYMRNSSLTADLEAAKAETKEQTENATSLSERLTAAQNDFTEKVNEADNLTAQLAAMQTETDEKTAEIAQLTEQLTAAQTKIADQSAEITALTEQLNTAQTDAEVKAADITALNEKVKLLQEEKEKLSAELAQKDTEILNVTTLKNAAQQKLNDLNALLQPVIVKFEELKEAVADSTLWQSIFESFDEIVNGIKEIFNQ